MLCDDLEGEMGVGWEGGKKEGTYVCRQLIHFIVQQKLTTL